MFMNALNSEAARFGINFDKYSIGTEVEYLDTKCYLEDGKIKHRLFRKPTDARRYLQRDSYHPSHTFKSVPTSQMMWVTKVNSEEENMKEDIEELKKDLMKSGYNKDEVEVAHQKLISQASNNTAQHKEVTQSPQPLIFSFQYFHQMNELKKVVRSLDKDLDALMGHHNIRFAARKGATIGSNVVKNRELCIPTQYSTSQKCGASGCLTCPSMLDQPKLDVNGVSLRLAKNVTCKSSDVIYVHKCGSCTSENVYVGQTSQKFADRNSGHRGKFNDIHYEESALSNHSYLSHGLGVTLKDFKCAIYKKCGFMNLHREEFKLCEKLRCKTLGLNRCKISK